MTVPQLNPFEQELSILTTMAHMNPQILRVGIAIHALNPGEPFIPKQIVELTDLYGHAVIRNMNNLRGAGLIERLPLAPENKHLRPHARTEHIRWSFFEDIERHIGLTSIRDLFGKDWEDIDPWLRNSKGVIKRTEEEYSL